jgi:glycosyltransferase involved in cell wall biosynthesis
MTIALGLVCNFWNEANALPGFLETHAQFFDHISMYQSGPGGAESDDGSIEILEKWKIPIHRGKIDDGFGIVRTAAIRSSPCEWVMLLDADERFYPKHQVLTCAGESTPREEVDKLLYDYGDPNYKEVVQEYDAGIEFDVCPSNFENLKRLGANLTVSFGDVYNQGAWLRDILEKHTTLDAVKTIRRHWHDFSWRRPTQNWHTNSDFQIRLVRNRDGIDFEPNIKMHEQLRGASNVYMPNHTHGPFFDHFHCFFKPMEVKQRKHDVAIYNAIDRRERPPTWEEFKAR